MDYWQGPYRWINIVLLWVLGILVFDGLLRLVGAQDSNPVVGAVRWLADLLLAPFTGIWQRQSDVVTTLLAIVAYILLVLVVFTIMRSAEDKRDRRPDTERR